VTGSHLAAGFGLEKILEILLKGNDINADSKDSDSRTPLSWAAENGHEAVVKLLQLGIK
jgi:ankyrin repeat protein